MRKGGLGIVLKLCMQTRFQLLEINHFYENIWANLEWNERKKSNKNLWLSILHKTVCVLSYCLNDWRIILKTNLKSARHLLQLNIFGRIFNGVEMKKVLLQSSNIIDFRKLSLLCLLLLPCAYFPPLLMILYLVFIVSF